MRSKSIVAFAPLLSPLTIAACTLSLFRMPGAPPTTEILPSPEMTSVSSIPVPLHVTGTASPRAGTATLPASSTASATTFCADERSRSLISRFKSAIITADGALLASLVSPVHGMDARLFRNGRIVNYDREHAAALFDSSFVVDWGPAPGSGLATSGSFHELFVPDLLDVLTREYALSCNQIQVGGATYDATWPYAGIDFYSLHFPGTPEFGELDWHTWLLGMHYVGEHPYLYAIMQLKWEP